MEKVGRRRWAVSRNSRYKQFAHNERHPNATSSTRNMLYYLVHFSGPIYIPGGGKKGKKVRARYENSSIVRRLSPKTQAASFQAVFCFTIIKTSEISRVSLLRILDGRAISREKRGTVFSGCFCSLPYAIIWHGKWSHLIRISRTHVIRIRYKEQYIFPQA